MFHNRSKQYKYDNTRQYLRLPVSWPLKCAVGAQGGDRQHVTRAKDISAGGIRVLVPENIPLGHTVHVEIHVPPLNRVISAKGQVVRAEPQGNQIELGIRFVEIDPQDQTALSEAIDKFFSPDERSRQQQAWWRKIW